MSNYYLVPSPDTSSSTPSTISDIVSNQEQSNFLMQLLEIIEIKDSTIIRYSSCDWYLHIWLLGFKLTYYNYFTILHSW